MGEKIVLNHSLKEIIIIIRLIDLLLVVIVWNLLKSQENIKAKSFLSFEKQLGSKILSKSEDLFKFDTKETGLSFLTFGAKEIFHYL